MSANLKRITSKSADPPSAADVEKSGGPGIDLHIHDTHFIQLLNGMPDAVFSQGKLIGEKYTNYLTTQYIYKDNPVTISCSSGSISQKGRAFSHGFEIFLQKKLQAGDCFHIKKTDPKFVLDFYPRTKTHTTKRLGKVC